MTSGGAAASAPHRPMLDHIGLGVRDYERSKSFYKAALAPLGYEVLMEYGEQACGFGNAGKPVFWFTSPDRATDNGRPGVREMYHPSYYGAFVFDPDGNNVESVCHAPE